MNAMIELTSRERDEFERLLRLHPEARQYQRALVLLDEGERAWKKSPGACMFPRTVYNWLNRFEQVLGCFFAWQLSFYHCRQFRDCWCLEQSYHGDIDIKCLAYAEAYSHGQ